MGQNGFEFGLRSIQGKLALLSLPRPHRREANVFFCLAWKRARGKLMLSYLLQEGSDGGRPLREEEDLLVGGTGFQHREEKLQERGHTFFL